VLASLFRAGGAEYRWPAGTRQLGAPGTLSPGPQPDSGHPVYAATGPDTVPPGACIGALAGDRCVAGTGAGQL